MWLFHSFDLSTAAHLDKGRGAGEGKANYGINPPTESLELLGRSSTHSVYYSSCRTAYITFQLSVCPEEGF